jgi:hypothetical protein
MLNACFPFIRFMGKKNRFSASPKQSDEYGTGTSVSYPAKRNRTTPSLNQSAGVPQDILEIRSKYQSRGRFHRRELNRMEEYEHNRHFQHSEDTPLLTPSVEKRMQSFDAQHLTLLPRVPFEPEYYENALPLR